MKKILTILSAFGMTGLSGSSVVSCNLEKVASEGDWQTPDDGDRNSGGGGNSGGIQFPPGCDENWKPECWDKCRTDGK